MSQEGSTQLVVLCELGFDVEDAIFLSDSEVVLFRRAGSELQVLRAEASGASVSVIAEVAENELVRSAISASGATVALLVNQDSGLVLKLFDARNGGLVEQFDSDLENVVGCCFLSDSSEVVLVSYSGAIRVYRSSSVVN